MNIDAKKIGLELDELERFITTTPNLNPQQIKKWAAECIAIFSYLQVPHEIIRGFMSMFEFSDGVHIFAGSKGGGATYDMWVNPARMSDRVSGFFFTNIAFMTSRNLLQKLAELERLVPQSLITLLQKKYHDISTTLESVESSFQSNNTDNLIANAQSVLQLIINLDPTLKSVDQKGLKYQLNMLLNPKNLNILNNFGCDAELMSLFHNYRYLRNVTSQHKKGLNFARLPIAIGYGFASLVLYFLHCVMAEGILIKT